MRRRRARRRSFVGAGEHFGQRRPCQQPPLRPRVAGAECLVLCTNTMHAVADVIEAAFVESNPGLARDQVTVTCTQGMIQEVRICLTPGLEPRRCGADVIRDCTMTDAALDAVR